MKAAVVAIALAALARPADARDWESLANRLGGAAWLHYELTALHDVDDTATGPGMQELVLAGARLHGIVGTVSFPILYHVGFDVAVGGTLRGAGAGYDVAVFPVGAAVRLGEPLVALGVGVGSMGGPPVLDSAVTFPIELTCELGGRVRVLTRARASYVRAAKHRHGGAPSLPFGDELEAMLGVRIGRHEGGQRFPAGHGYFVAASYRELEGARFVGLTIGYSIDLGTRRARERRVPGEDGAYYVSRERDVVH